MTEETVDRAPCLCGCGGFPKGRKSRFIPGHDARYHSAQKKAGVVVEQLPPHVTPDGTINEVVRDRRRTRLPRNGQDAPPAPSRRRKAKDGATENAGSDA